MTECRTWHGYWIKANQGVDNPGAPYFQKSITCGTRPRTAVAAVASAGWHELFVNGKKADDRVLAPAVSQFDRHVFFVEYDIASLLCEGVNSIVLLIGHGLYNDLSDNAWNFRNAPWRDEPKVMCDILVDGVIAAATDASWKTAPSPIFYNNFRCGEKYDSRLEIPGIDRPDFDAAPWKNAVQANPPGGVPIRESAPPCRITQRYPAVSCRLLHKGVWIYDFGTNLTGRCELIASGPAGAEIRLEYGEQLRASGDLDRAEISAHVYGQPKMFQCELFTLNGTPHQHLHSHFVYHGFRFVKIFAGAPGLTLESVEAGFIHTDFEREGAFVSSDETLNVLDRLTRQSYLSNFTGIPTDCPHREKNGWTGDAQLAMEPGCWNFHVEQACSDFLRSVADCERGNGQLPGIVPTGGWGYNWGSGPAWDAILFEYPWRIWQFYGNVEPIRRHYADFKRYVDYCTGMAEDGLIRFGLGDWCSGSMGEDAPVELTSSGYYFNFAVRMAAFAQLLGHADDELYYRSLAAEIRAAVNRKFYRGGGVYANGAQTALACALYFELADAAEAPLVAEKLVESVRQAGHTAQFGILGAKWVPRVLADYGFIDDAYRMLVQPEMPGWGYWVRQGATSLWEHWTGESSQNHIMFGDISAWMYQYLGGLQMADGKLTEIRPMFPHDLASVDVTFRGAHVAWRREKDEIVCSVSLPREMDAVVTLPGLAPVRPGAGEHTFRCRA